MPAVTFSHKAVDKIMGGSLHVQVGMDDVAWSYKLNTQTYPTYGGEVVQILSTYTDNLTVGGTVGRYAKMEQIYNWFLTYMQVASQGVGDRAYNQEPVQFRYQQRGWTFHIKPMSLPGFRYGRDVVAPEWRLMAHVEEDEPEVREMNLQAALDGIKTLTPGIGYRADNPFSDPFATDKRFKPSDLEKYYDKAADYFSKLIPKYMEGDYDSLLGEIGSKPAFLDKKAPRDGEQRRERK